MTTLLIDDAMRYRVVCHGHWQVYSRYLYFSIATLTSTGFGDVTPAFLSARMVATIEMFLGALLLWRVGWSVRGGVSA